MTLFQPCLGRFLQLEPSDRGRGETQASRTHSHSTPAKTIPRRNSPHSWPSLTALSAQAQHCVSLNPQHAPGPLHCGVCSWRPGPREQLGQLPSRARFPVILAQVTSGCSWLGGPGLLFCVPPGPAGVEARAPTVSQRSEAGVSSGMCMVDAGPTGPGPC